MKKHILSLLLTAVIILSSVPCCVYSVTASDLIENDFEYSIYNNTATVVGYVGNESNIVIPDALGGYPVCSIERQAFSSCVAESITIPNSVTSIGQHSFSYCKIENIIVDADNPVYSSADGVLFNKKLTRLITYPSYKKGSYTIPDTVIVIAAYAFYNCSKLTEVTISDNVTTIGSSSFDKCTNLKTVTMGDGVTEIGSDAFNFCTSLSKLNISNNVTKIGDCAFSRCSSLTDVNIPDSVTSIGLSAFSNCSNLKTLTIGRGVTNIAELAFSYCTSLETVNFNAEKCTTMGTTAWTAFKYSDKISNVFIGDNVKTIPNYAFLNCTAITSVTIPECVTIVGKRAFEGCSNLANITILNDACKIDSSAFYNTAYYNNENNYQDGVLYIGNYLIAAKNDIISCDIKDGTATIAVGAFEERRALQKITIPSSVTYICERAFYSCLSLTDVYYDGVKSEWDSIKFEYILNDPLFSANVHFNEKDVCEHRYEWVIDVQATCGMSGLKHRACINPGCDFTDSYETEIIPTGKHTSDNGKVIKKSTTKKNGKIVYTCTSCNTVIITQALPKLPKTVSLKSFKSPKKKQVKVTWAKDSKVSGYQILYATNSKFTKGKKTITVKGYKTTSKTIKNLKSKKTYYVKIRSYKTVKGKKIYGAYSKVKKVKVK